MARFLNSGSIKTFQQNITASGTPEQLTSYPVPEGVSVVVKAKKTNTGTITIGGSSAQALNSDTSYFPLENGEAVSYQVTNTDKIWFDGTVTGEGIQVTLEY
jgi:hypothetical protein